MKLPATSLIRSLRDIGKLVLPYFSSDSQEFRRLRAFAAKIYLGDVREVCEVVSTHRGKMAVAISIVGREITSQTSQTSHSTFLYCPLRSVGQNPDNGALPGAARLKSDRRTVIEAHHSPFRFG
jgi:hypothetical protein